ncbi:MAG: hypothetical protein ABSB65_03975 [Candidatus Acidiferrales bacterium]
MSRRRLSWIRVCGEPSILAHDLNSGAVPASIRGTLFNPFVSSGKSNGTGLGVAIVSKVIHDHGGT